MASAVGRNADDFWKTILAFVLSGPMGIISALDSGLRRGGGEKECAIYMILYTDALFCSRSLIFLFLSRSFYASSVSCLVFMTKNCERQTRGVTQTLISSNSILINQMRYFYHVCLLSVHTHLISAVRQRSIPSGGSLANEGFESDGELSAKPEAQQTHRERERNDTILPNCRHTSSFQRA